MVLLLLLFILLSDINNISAHTNLLQNGLKKVDFDYSSYLNPNKWQVSNDKINEILDISDDTIKENKNHKVVMNDKVNVLPRFKEVFDKKPTIKTSVTTNYHLTPAIPSVKLSSVEPRFMELKSNKIHKTKVHGTKHAHTNKIKLKTAKKKKKKGMKHNKKKGKSYGNLLKKTTKIATSMKRKIQYATNVAVGSNGKGLSGHTGPISVINNINVKTPVRTVIQSKKEASKVAAAKKKHYPKVPKKLHISSPILSILGFKKPITVPTEKPQSPKKQKRNAKRLAKAVQHDKKLKKALKPFLKQYGVNPSKIRKPNIKKKKLKQYLKHIGIKSKHLPKPPKRPILGGHLDEALNMASLSPVHLKATDYVLYNDLMKTKDDKYKKAVKKYKKLTGLKKRIHPTKEKKKAKKIMKKLKKVAKKRHKIQLKMLKNKKYKRKQAKHKAIKHQKKHYKKLLKRYKKQTKKLASKHNRRVLKRKISKLFKSVKHIKASKHVPAKAHITSLRGCNTPVCTTPSIQYSFRQLESPQSLLSKLESTKHQINKHDLEPQIGRIEI